MKKTKKLFIVPIVILSIFVSSLSSIAAAEAIDCEAVWWACKAQCDTYQSASALFHLGCIYGCTIGYNRCIDR